MELMAYLNPDVWNQIAGGSLEKEIRTTMVMEACKQFGGAANNYQVKLGRFELRHPRLDALILLCGSLTMLNAAAYMDSYRKAMQGYLKSQALPWAYGCALEVRHETAAPKQPPVTGKAPEAPLKPEDKDADKNAPAYIAVEPAYSFDRVILSAAVLERIENALHLLACKDLVFRQWGLRVIQPHPSAAMNFYGPSGTGKTMAAEAIAKKLGKKIIRVSYADIESKYHGEGPKNVVALFAAAQAQDAVLFLDEADSLLSKRLTNVTQGSEQAINSMRSQLLICLEQYEGVVIFATNLVINYDQAFLTRLICVEFEQPDEATRERIWRVHLYPTPEAPELRIPLAADVDIRELARKYAFCGRSIRNVTIQACLSAALRASPVVDQDCLMKAAEKEVQEQLALTRAKDHTQAEAPQLTPPQKELLNQAVQYAVEQKKAAQA